MNMIRPEEFLELLYQMLGTPVASARLKLPPTSNNIYTTRRKGASTVRMLSDAARSWKRRAVQEIIRQSRLALTQDIDPNGLYWLCLNLRFEKIENDNYNQFFKRGPKAGQRKGTNRWKKMDIDNRIKLSADAMKNSTGVDDCAHFTHILLKDVNPDDPGMDIVLWQVEDHYALGL